MITVKVIRREGEAALVEFTLDGALQRVLVPAAAVERDRAPRAELERGIPWGAPWAELVTLRASAERLQEELRRRGLWNLEDLQARPDEARGAITAAYGVDVAALINAAIAWERQR